MSLNRAFTNTIMYMSYAYDDFLSIIHLTTRSALAKHLDVSYDILYHGFTLYYLGFFTGIVLTNMLSNIYSNRKIVFYSQFLILSCHLLITYTNTLLLLCIRFLEGFAVSSSIISISLLLHNYFGQKFNKFLTYYFIFICIIEVCIPLVSTLSSSFHIKNVFFIVSFIALNCLYGFSISKIRDIKMGKSLSESFIKSFLVYSNIINSRFALVLCMIAFSNGIPDYLTSMLESSIISQNQYLFPYLLSMLSVGSLCIIKLVDYIFSNTDDIKYLIKTLVYLFLISLYILFPIALLKNPYIVTLLKSVLMGCMYSIECLCTQHIYTNIKETASVTSSVLLANALGSLASYIIGMFFSANISILILLMLLGISIFIYNHLVKLQQSRSKMIEGY